MRVFILAAFVLCVFCGSVHAQIITSFAGTGTAGFSGDHGAATAATFNDPEGMAIDDSGNVYIADAGNNRIRKISTTGIITTIAGTGVAGFGGDSGPAINAQLNRPVSIALDQARNIYIADYNNSRIRVINTSGSIATLAGTGVAGYGGDHGAATVAQISRPTDVATDAAGNVYIADEDNMRVRKISTAGIITTVAGNGFVGYIGNGGPASAASLHSPAGVSVDSAGNLYIADKLNHVVRKVTPAGIISTFAGGGLPGYGGDGGMATNALFNYPTGVTTDTAGNVFVADRFNSRIRVISATDSIRNFAGSGSPIYSGNGGAATNAGLVLPARIAADRFGNLYISDSADNVIRRVSPFVNHAPSFSSGNSVAATVCVGSGPNAINNLLTVTDADAGQPIMWSIATAPVHGTATAAYSTVSTGGALMPAGITYAPAAGYSGADSLQVQVFDGFAADTIKVIVNVNTSLMLTSSLSLTVCSGSPVNYQAVSNTPGALITWSRAAVAGITPATGTGGSYIGETLLNTTATPLHVVYVFDLVSSSCSITQDVLVTVEPVSATITPHIGTTSPSWLCENTLYQNFGASAPADSGVTYQWSAKNAVIWATGNTRQYCLANFPNTGLSFIYLTATLPGSSCGSTDSFGVAVGSFVAESHAVVYYNGSFSTEDGMYSYQWGYDDRATLQPTAITGATASWYDNAAPDFTHKYYWVITEHLSCRQKTYYVTPATVQDNGGMGIKNVVIFPNPSNGVINVNVTSEFNDAGTVTITDVTGALFFKSGYPSRQLYQ